MFATIQQASASIRTRSPLFDSEDVAQELATKLLARGQNIDELSEGFLRRSTRNQFIDMRREQLSAKRGAGARTEGEWTIVDSFDAQANYHPRKLKLSGCDTSTSGTCQLSQLIKAVRIRCQHAESREGSRLSRNLQKAWRNSKLE
jgi:hypothetical protein